MSFGWVNALNRGSHVNVRCPNTPSRILGLLSWDGMFAERLTVQGESTLYRVNRLFCTVHNQFHRFTPVLDVRLPIVFVEQQGVGANLSPNDCGPACSLALLRSYNLAKDETVDSLVRQMGASNGRYTSLAENVQIMYRHGLKTSARANVNVAALLESLSQHKPVILLTNYQHVVPFGKRFAHFIVVVGCFVACDALFFTVHDPLQRSAHVVSAEKMVQAISDPVNNRPYQAIIANIPLPVHDAPR